MKSTGSNSEQSTRKKKTNLQPAVMDGPTWDFVDSLRIIGTMTSWLHDNINSNENMITQQNHRI